MEREILFRGKRKDNGEWVYGDPHHLYDDKIRIISNLTDKMRLAPTLYEVIPETVGTFTSLSDRNGTRIFEGDILRMHECHEILFRVLFEEGCFLARKQNESHLWRLSRAIYFGGGLEVIGNIHDDPELERGVSE